MSNWAKETEINEQISSCFHQPCFGACTWHSAKQGGNLFCLINNFIRKKVIQKGEKATIKLIVAEELLQKNNPVIFFTRTKEMIRGEVLSFRYDDLFEH